MAGLGLGKNNSDLPPFNNSSGSNSTNGSMILYRLADDPRTAYQKRIIAGTTATNNLLPPPHFKYRHSVESSAGDSILSLSFTADPNFALPNSSAIPPISSIRGLVPYLYDPSPDSSQPIDDEDRLHDPTIKPEKNSFPWRGIGNISILLFLISASLCLFVFYPIWTFVRDRARNLSIDGNIRINATGQAPVLFQIPQIIDSDTPTSAHSRQGFDGVDYELVFSDEFNTPGRTFYPGDDPYWEAVDLWYGSTGDLEWYDPQQITTRDGALVITMDSVDTTQPHMTPGSTAPFTTDMNHGLNYRSGMLQTWNKFCFTTGYVEVSVTFPGPDEDTTGYWPGAWTMGNLARPGYAASTQGMWPYTYDSCDVGTFPNQTDPDGSGPAAALHTDAGRSVYNFELSWLPGQRASSCSCPGSDHPGPTPSRGRGAPEIDVFEAEKDKNFPTGQVVSQSAQFAPFTHDYLYGNGTGLWTNWNVSSTRANTYRGSALQQAISSLTRTPSDMFQGTGNNFKTFGFEYWSDPNNRQNGFINWQVDGKKTSTLWAASVGPDQDTGGSGVGQRLIPEEPMAIILNLGMSPNWQPIDLSTMIFPAEFKIDYVRVYQRKGQTNTGCNPKNYPTADYITNHLEAYTNPNLTSWPWPTPKNSLFSG
ncbi:beta-glucan synthesis-associated, partial [Phlegmacium glaucopus]